MDMDNRIISAMCAVMSQDESPDRALVAEQLMKTGELEDVGGLSRLIDIYDESWADYLGRAIVRLQSGIHRGLLMGAYIDSVKTPRRSHEERNN